MILTLLALAGCGGGDPTASSGGSSGPSIVALVVEPDQVDVLTGPDGGEPVPFTATATFEDGTVSTLTVAEWTLSNQSVGSIDEDGVFTPSDSNGGDTWVTARLDNLDAQAVVTVIYEGTIQSGSDVDPGDFEGQGEPLADAWLYPEDGVNIPRNTPGIHFQWRSDLGVEAWRLRFTSAYTDLAVYTRDSDWEADADIWQRIAATNAGGQVSVGLMGRMPDGSLVEAEPLEIQVNRLDARGSILYWSSSIEGFKQIPYGGLAEDYLTSAETGTCMGCHTVSDNRMAFTYDDDGTMGVVDLETGALLEPPEDIFFGSFKSFSPDGALLLTTYHGALLLYDGQTLEYRWEVPLDFKVTQVDWSPDGRQIALVSSDEMVTDAQFTEGRVYVLDHYGSGQFSEPRLLYASAPGTNTYYPAWSPDGEWIAFNISTGDAYDDPDAELMVIRPEPGAEPIALDAANSVGELTNSWPRWGPLPDDDIFWLTFASRRAYGAITEDVPQIWVAGFDPARADAGEDPSWPAFWLPSQSTEENNHLPFWTD